MKSFEMILYFPFAAQGLFIAVDEFYFHRRRGLPLWERIGHPLDTLSVLLCYIFILMVPYSTRNLMIYFFLCAFSSLFVTKDEYVHKDLCNKVETWLHAVLYLLHPVTFFCAGYLWRESGNLEVVRIQAILVFCFMLYQIFYWSLRGTKSASR